MKKLIGCLMLFLIGTQAQGDWTSDWLQQQTHTDSGRFESESRNYFYGSTYSARWPSKTDYLVNIQRPRLNFGCGGIDLFAGSMSLAEPDYLVKKFQRIISTAPALAFDLALKLMSESVAESMGKIDSALAALNALQINDCAAQKNPIKVWEENKALVQQAYQDIKGAGAALHLLNNGATSSHIEAGSSINLTKGEKAPEGATEKQQVAHCPADFVDFFTNGSVLAKVANKLGLSAYTEMIRGYVGDVLVTYDEDRRQYNSISIQHCPGNEIVALENFIEGTILERSDRPGPQPCVASPATNLRTQVERTLQGITQKMQMRQGARLNADEMKLINSSPFPIFKALQTGVIIGAENAMVQRLTPPLLYGAAQQMILDLNARIKQALALALDKNHFSQQDLRCTSTVLTPIIDDLKIVSERAEKMTIVSTQAYMKKLNELSVSTQMAEQLERQYKQAKGRVFGQINRGGR